MVVPRAEGGVSVGVGKRPAVGVSARWCYAHGDLDERRLGWPRK
jgi:hypothetical protein